MGLLQQGQMGPLLELSMRNKPSISPGAGPEPEPMRTIPGGQDPEPWPPTRTARIPHGQGGLEPGPEPGPETTRITREP